MGNFSITSGTAFSYPPEVIYDFVTNPANWGQTYKGSGGVHQNLPLPLKVGDTWDEKVDLSPNLYVSTRTLITAVRPRKWMFQQTDKIGMKADGTGGVDWFKAISYTFERPGHDV
jgi:hypothetical protein